MFSEGISMINRACWLVLLLFLCSTAGFCANKDGWMKEVNDQWATDYDKVKTAAQNNGKPILLDFSGSDWCGWCQRLDEEVFQKEEFKKWAAKNLNLCLLDFPRNPAKVSPAQREKNQKVARSYGVRGYPTVLLLEVDGTLIARTGYREGGAAKYVEHLKGLIKHCRGWQKKLKALPDLKGKKRVLTAANLFKHCADALGDKIIKVAEIIFRYDKKDTTGLRGDAALIVAGVESPLAKHAEKFLKSIAKTDDKKRYGFLLFTRTTNNFRELLSTAEKNKGNELGSKDVKKAAIRLYKRLKVARKFVPNKEMMANIYLRMAVALACGGRKEKAKKALARAEKLGVPKPMLAGYGRFIEEVK